MNILKFVSQQTKIRAKIIIKKNGFKTISRKKIGYLHVTKYE